MCSLHLRTTQHLPFQLCFFCVCLCVCVFRSSTGSWSRGSLGLRDTCWVVLRRYDRALALWTLTDWPSQSSRYICRSLFPLHQDMTFPTFTAVGVMLFDSFTVKLWASWQILRHPLQTHLHMFHVTIPVGNPRGFIDKEHPLHKSLFLQHPDVATREYNLKMCL